MADNELKDLIRQMNDRLDQYDKRNRKPEPEIGYVTARIPVELKQEFQDMCRQDGTNCSKQLMRFIDQYVYGEKPANVTKDMEPYMAEIEERINALNYDKEKIESELILSDSSVETWKEKNAKKVIDQVCDGCNINRSSFVDPFGIETMQVVENVTTLDENDMIPTPTIDNGDEITDLLTGNRDDDDLLNKAKEIEDKTLEGVNEYIDKICEDCDDLDRSDFTLANGELRPCTVRKVALKYNSNELDMEDGLNNKAQDLREELTDGTLREEI